jgi:hypothetical protein
MSDSDGIDDLLSVYFAIPGPSGRPAPEELCRERPELLPELLRRIAALEAMDRLAAGASEETKPPSASLDPTLTAVYPPTPTMRLAVEVTTGPHASLRVELDGHDAYAVGRQPGLALSLPDDARLSRVHMLLDTRGGKLRAIDLGSTGGTFVAGARVETAELFDGNEVRLGSTTTLRVHILGEANNNPGPGQPPAIHTRRPDGPPVIPGYAIGRELGRGNMGVVYHATREATGEEVALKTILPTGTIPSNAGISRTAIGRFCREAETLGRLQHPNVVGYRDSGAVGGVLFVAMEFVPGVDAAGIVAREGPLPLARVSQWAGQFLDGLGHAHAAGLVHRDVKPGNILVCPGLGGEVVKVSDFGLARAYDASGLSGLTADNAVGGTPAFMPPEQVTDFRNVRPAADQYAAGATLFFLLTGQYIYPRMGTAVEALRRIVTEDPVPLRPDSPPVPEPFGSAIRQSLARDPAARFRDVRAMRDAILGR